MRNFAAQPCFEIFFLANTRNMAYNKQSPWSAVSLQQFCLVLRNTSVTPAPVFGAEILSNRNPQLLVQCQQLSNETTFTAISTAVWEEL